MNNWLRTGSLAHDFDKLYKLKLACFEQCISRSTNFIDKHFMIFMDHHGRSTTSRLPILVRPGLPRIAARVRFGTS